MIILGILILLLFSVCGCYTDKSCTFTNLNLHVNCSRRDLFGIPRHLPTNITVLDLSYNSISQIDRTISRYRNLSELYINNNNINNLKDDAFVGVRKLKILSLAGNRIHPKVYTENMFGPLVRLEELYIQRNLKKPSPFKAMCNQNNCTYPDGAFGLLVNLKILSVDLCEYSNFGKGFRHLKKLKKLTFDYCLACELKNKTFQNFRFSNVTELNLCNCVQYKASSDIESGILVPFKNAQSLDISNSYFSFRHTLKLLHPFRNKKMDLINLHRVSRKSRETIDNPFKITVTKDMMKYLRTICVRTLIVSYNGIVDIKPGSLLAYDHPECFESVVFSANSFTFGYNSLYMELITLSTLAVNLKFIDYSYIPIDFKNMDFILPPKLNVTNAYSYSTDHKYTTSRSSPVKMTFYLPPKLEFLRLSHVMSLSKLFKLEIKRTKNLKHLDLSYFQFQAFPEILMPDGNNLQFVDLSGIDAGMYVDKGIAQLSREVEIIKMRDANLDRTFKQGKNMFEFLRNNTKSLDISLNHLTDLPEQFGSISSLQYLNLSFNSFRHFPNPLLSIYSLKTLDMRFNKLLTLDEAVTRWLDTVSHINNNFTLLLDGNEFLCSCENRKFIKWLSATIVKLDRERNYTCRLSNGTIASATVVILQFHDIFSHCDAVAWLRVGVICIVCSFVIIGLSTVIYQFRWRMAYFLYRKLKANYLTHVPNMEFKYDIFIAYATDSTEWLFRTLVPKLEEQWKFSVCLKDRDFPVGADHADTIINSIRNSKFVIFIITQEFVKRKWGRFEIEMAKYEMFEQRGQKRIIVILKDGVNHEDVPYELSLTWKDIKMIGWPRDNVCTDNVWYDLKLQLA